MIDPVSKIPVAERSITHVLARQAAARGDKLAFRDANVAVTYAEAQRAAFCMANHLLALDLSPGDAVITFLNNHADALSIWLGLSAGRMVEVPVNPAYLGAMLHYVVGHSGARVAFVEQEFCNRIADIADDLPDLRTIIVRGGSGEGLPSRFNVIRYETLLEGVETPLEPASAWDQMAIMYTSGTTGASKGVIIPHAQAFCAALSYSKTSADDVMMVSQPLFHIGGRWHGVYNALVHGATAVIPERFSASGFWDEVREYGCTSALLVGAMGDFLWKQPSRPDDRDHPLQRMQLAPLIKEADAFAKRFGVELVTGYGMTELGVAIYSEPGEKIPLGSTGRLRPDFEARIVDEHDVEVPEGKTGELAVRGRHPWTIMNGYHDMPEATIAAWRNQWFHTGDAMRRDADGYYYFVDRKKDAMRRRGENVSSFEVEAQLLSHEDVMQAAVVAVPSEHSEDDILAVVVVQESVTLDPAELLRYLVGKLPYFMVPRYIRVVDALPMTPTFRVKKPELRAEGITENTWDCEQAGLRVTRDGLVSVTKKQRSAEVERQQ
ncbi:AMP-binding protein [Parasphingorhabdus sp.]|uniref:AMP-binding protein n=1 Tax=Parasphingorhabdus sp. TaxID=2709688 RepID=UPI003A8E17E6